MLVFGAAAFEERVQNVRALWRSHNTAAGTGGDRIPGAKVRRRKLTINMGHHEVVGGERHDVLARRRSVIGILYQHNADDGYRVSPSYTHAQHGLFWKYHTDLRQVSIQKLYW